MARPISWLTRLADIRRSVANSVRSHYERKDIERLFQIQPRAAQALIRGIAPSVKVGRSSLVARADLEAFLDRVAEGSDPASLLVQAPPVPRRSLRDLIQQDEIAAALDMAPQSLVLEAGRLSIEFRSMEELASSLLALAQILSDPVQFATFESRFIPQQETTRPDHAGRDDVDRLFAELESLEFKFAEHSVLCG